MDEGVKVQVDGRVVGYLDHNNLSPTGSRIQLFTASVPPNADGSHYVRVTNLNSCGHERPLELSLELADPDDKADGAGVSEGSGGCSAGHESGRNTLAIGGLALGIAWLRRRRRTVR